MGRALRAVRQQRCDSLDQAAHQTGVSRLTILNFETGRTDPKLSTVIALADYLGIAIVLKPKENSHARRLSDCH